MTYANCGCLLLDLDAMACAAVDRAPTTFGWVDLSAQAGVKAALGRNKASIVALDALTKGHTHYIHTYVCMCECMHVCMYIYVHTHTHYKGFAP